MTLPDISHILILRNPIVHEPTVGGNSWRTDGIKIRATEDDNGIRVSYQPIHISRRSGLHIVGEDLSSKQLDDILNRQHQP